MLAGLGTIETFDLKEPTKANGYCPLPLLAKARQVSVTKLIEEMATVLIADFDAETRFALRAARGRGQLARGKALLAKARYR